MKFVLVSFLVLVVLFLSLSCNEGYDYSQAALGLDLQDYSCTEAWIEVQIGSNDKTADIYIKKNDEIIKTIRIGQSDSLFYFDSLQPNTSYKFDAVTYEDGKEVKSNPVTFTTLDTTSHNFTWQTFEFGQHSNSTLYDVAIINENDIWAVGEIYMNDSLGNPDPNAYNAIHWDGQSWELKKVKTLFRGNIITIPISGIFAFSPIDIWMVGSLPIHGDGTAWIMYDVRTTIDPNLSLSKGWGTSPNNAYFVGENGSIAHYNGNNWSKIESGTDVDLKDVYGTKDGSIVWISGKTELHKSVLYKIESGQIKKVFEDSFPWQIQSGKISGGIESIWTNSRSFIYLTTPINAYRSSSNTSGDGKEIYPFNDELNGGTARIRGTAANNIVTAGNNSSVLHYNGYSWKIYSELLNNLTFLSSVDINDNTIVSVGDKMENTFLYKAIIAIGRRN
ncbi:MAG TPA: hypothetical protein DHV28_08290 [Ignavibacteriales bacterium]|nr:hypothetical protein [Ignavibacteriales bacterium]